MLHAVEIKLPKDYPINFRITAANLVSALTERAKMLGLACSVGAQRQACSMSLNFKAMSRPSVNLSLGCVGLVGLELEQDNSDVFKSDRGIVRM